MSHFTTTQTASDVATAIKVYLMKGVEFLMNLISIAGFVGSMIFLYCIV